MKKILILIIVFVIIFLLYSKSNDNFTIPNDAIRFRIIANSNDFNDQLIKERLRNNLEPIITDMLKDVNNIDEARLSIENNLNNISVAIEEFLKENNYDPKFNINYGNNYFPKKVYKGLLYKEGKYESLVITLGKGNGDNWWCLLFPPICYADFEDTKEVEYKLLIKQIFDKLK